MVQKWDAMSTSVPQVVQRLVAVKELHEQGKTEPVKMQYIVSRETGQEQGVGARWCWLNNWVRASLELQLLCCVVQFKSILRPVGIKNIKQCSAGRFGSCHFDLYHIPEHCWRT